jgi:hypothetical protein
MRAYLWTRLSTNAGTTVNCLNLRSESTSLKASVPNPKRGPFYMKWNDTSLRFRS